MTPKHRRIMQRVVNANGRRLLAQEETTDPRAVSELLRLGYVELGADMTVKDRKEGGPAATLVATRAGRDALAATQ